MSSDLLRALTVSIAMSIFLCPDALAQSAPVPETEASTSATEENEDSQAPAGGTQLDTILVLDVGAGANATAGANLITIDQQEIDRKKPQDLREVFSGEPQIAVGGAIPSTQKIYVNGVDENNLAVTVDGSRQNNKVFHHNGTYLLDPALLKAASVQAGVAPADAGPGALAGSLGFETKDAVDLLEPGRNFGGFVTGIWDTNSGTFTTGVSAFGQQDGFEYLGYINYGRGGNFTAGNGEGMPGTGTDLISGLAKVAYESVEGHRFELSHERVRDDALRPYRANVYINRPGREPELRNYDLRRQNTVFTYTDTSPEGWWDPKIVLAYSKTQIAAPEYFFDVVSPTEGATSSFNGKVENRFALDIGSVTAGFDFYNDKADLDYLNPTEPLFTDERATNIGAYAQARLEPFDRTRISFGGRADHQWFTGVDDSDWNNAGLSGNISGEYDLIPEFLTVKAGTSHVWGGVPLAENYLQNPLWTYGDGPEPVTSNNYTAGLEARYNGFTFEANVFRTHINDARLPVFGRGAPVPVFTSIRTLDLVSKGWEIGGRYDWDAGFVSLKYADINADVDGEPADTEIGRYLTTPLGQIVMIGAGYTFDDWGVKVGGDIEIALRTDRTLVRHPTDPTSAKKELPGYEVVNAYVEWTPPSKPNFTLRADALNIFDEAYTDRAAYGQDFVGVAPHFDPGRSFRLSATARF
ncbi:TonB-dependent receptor [Mesorhizobium sp.]|uniref:TonB-dependent receptor domain-containing protein n=2 Tax=unclassified Mesorhizobium TaxID=325217 RepID=UPI000FE47864|nr:TonB-dependent receptor [Mesorhizobium sp.]RWG51866.1 MAG: TonB-dependent receptor [Mesorhizobium sp.]RWH44854.1 MAG: TonB-dependent receptor [Mesorhizobium sp.]RWH59054.1 MAG: TonB-dependent receptor [Mesorhizobium sp.]RWI78253.1 MAG: TonB-dependent receptor [Mesorhizobium sp.]RWI79754.1 MAG: TonB-dependent receptor [Mesorhizobium sp.]